MEKKLILVAAAVAVGGYALWSYTKKKNATPYLASSTATTTSTGTASAPVDNSDVTTPPIMQPPQSSVAFEGFSLPVFAKPVFIQETVKSGLSKISSFN